MKKNTKKIKKWKRIKKFTLIGFIASVSVGVSAIFWNNRKPKINVKSKKNSFQTLVSKIKDKNLIIDKVVDTSNDAKILLAIKNQLKNQNPLLTNEDLLNIDDNISSLTPGVKTDVVLTILIDDESNTVKITVIRPLSDLESVNFVKNKLESLDPKEITINKISGTITDNKQAVLNAVNSLISSASVDLKGTKITIKEEDTELTLSGTPFTIEITKGLINQKITSFKVKRSKNTQETNNDKVAKIKDKIKDKDLIIAKNVNTSNDAKILIAIKNQLKNQNSLLTNEDLLKITDNISSLTPGVKTYVVLTILVGTESDTVKITVTRPLSDLESVNFVKNKLESLDPKEITINKISGTITDNKQPLLNAIKSLISSASIDLKGTKISIKEEDTELTLSGVPFTILISKGSTTKKITSFKVKRSKSIQETNNDKIVKIKDKIKDKDLIINKNVDTSNDANILLAIKTELKKQNPLLTNQDLLKINDDISSLSPGVKTNVVLTISVGTESDIVKITVIRPLSDLESVNAVKNKLESLDPKEITINATSGTITDHKQAVLNAVNSLISFASVDLKGTKISIKEEDNELTLSGVAFTILISKGIVTKKITSFKVKRSKNTQEINNDKINAIKNKIVDKELIINKNVDTSDDAKILTAIKNQLKIENPSLSNEDLLKITDSIDSLTPGLKTNVVLTILVGTESDNVNIEITRPLTDLELVNEVKKELEKISPKEITISATSGTITDNKQAIIDAFELLISSKNINLKGTNILVKEEDTELTLEGVPFTIEITKGSITKEIVSMYIVKRVENNVEKNKRKIALIKSKIKIKTFDIDKNVDTSDDAKTLLAIKNQLKIENPSLSDQDLLKIDDNITSLAPNKKTTVTLIISIGLQRDIVKISTERDYSDLESVDKTKYALEKNAPKEITVSATSGTISDHKNLIAKTLKKNYWFKVILASFKLANIAIKEEDTKLTLKGVPFTILISKGSITKEIVSMYIVKRSKNIQEKNIDKVATIKNNIVDKNLIIGKNVNTSNDAALLQAIKNQLNIQNPLLTKEDLSKINDNINSLVPEKRTPVTLTILAGTESDTTEIWVTRPLSDAESIDVVKNELENLVSKEITISATSGTITDHKQAIFNALDSLIQSSKIDLKGTSILVKEEDTELTLNGTPFTILISKGIVTKKITSFKVKRSKNTQEVNNDKINEIKNKIKNKNLIIERNVDTSDDAKILLAIKNELKEQNPLLNKQDLLKINDDISSLTPKVKTNVVLTISIDTESDKMEIWVTRPLSDAESIDVVKNELENLVSKEITISVTSGTITNHKQAIFNALDSLIQSSKIDLKGTSILVKEEDTELTLNGTPFTIEITKGLVNQKITSFKVKRSKNTQEVNNDKINEIKDKIKDKDLIIERNVDTSNDAKILTAIKNELKDENPSLSDEDLLKISDNIDSLTPGVQTSVVLKILIGTQSDTIDIQVIRPLNEIELVNEVKKEFEKISPKEITISATSGTINDNHQAILDVLNSLIKSSNIDLKGAIISIKWQDTELTLNAIPFTIKVSKWGYTGEITSFKVKRSKNTQEINNDKINAIKDKIKNKNLIINKNVDTSDNAKILIAIKNELKKQNVSLSDQDLLKITDSIDSLTPGVKTDVVLTISIDTESDNVDIEVTRPSTDLELVNEVKKELESLSPKEITISATFGTITDNKEAIFNAFDLLIKSSKINLKGTSILVKEEDIELTLSGTPFTIEITKGLINQEITSFKVKRSKNTQEINNDKINAIKNKIVDKKLIINKNVDTSDDAKILLAIKNQLKIENPLLNDEDLLKITDNIDSLIPGEKTNVVLTISIDTESDNVDIEVTRPLTDLELVNEVKKELEKISPKEITISATSGTITDNKQAIIDAFELLISSKNINLKGTNILVKEEDTELTLKGVPFTIEITKGLINREITSAFIVKRSLTNQEIILKIKSKIKNKILTIPKNIDTSNDLKILTAIKNELKDENPSLSDEDLLKITDNIDSLTPGIKTNVILRISIDTESDNVDIEVTRPLTDLESVNDVKKEFENLSPKEITIITNSGTITDNKIYIINGLKVIIPYSIFNLKGVNISIKEEDTKLTLNGVPFTILISKGKITQQITNWKVKRSKNTQEINNDKINAVKDKIKNKILIINPNVDISDDAKILLAIKNQLKKQNLSLSDEDLLKITDNIDSLTPGIKTNVVLKIAIGTESDTIDIEVTRPLTDLESVNIVKKELESLSPKEITISATSGTITNNKQAILDALKLLINTKNIDLRGTNILIKEEDTELTLKGTAFTIEITKGLINQQITSFKVKKSLTNQQIVSTIKSKIQNKVLRIAKNVDTSNDAKILIAIKNQLKTQNPSLNDKELEKITDNIINLKPEKKILVILKIKSGSITESIKIFVTKKRNIKLWTKNSAIVKGSNINDGINARIFQDSSGNLWIMSYKKRLQVLKRDSSQWTSSTTSGLTKGSNIEYGMNGIIFEDSFGNLWAMGRKWEYDESKLREGKLQVLIKNKDGTFADSWIDTNEKLLKGSNIKNGYNEAAIFEDSSGNIWAMSENTKLKVLKKQKDGTFVDSWTDDNSEKGEKLLRDSNIINGKKGFIFEDSSGNIWAMGSGTRLQVLAKKKDGTFEDRWNSNGKLLSGSNINNGELGIMFEDSFGNLWAIAKNTKLQVLRKKKDGSFANTWTNDNEPLLKDSNVRNSEGGMFIFQDSSKNLWIMSKDSKLQVLKANQNGDGYVDSWTNNNGLNNEKTSDKRKSNINRRPLNNDNSNNKKIEKLLKNSNINDGQFGFIFEDSSGNLWAMANGSKLQVLVKNEDGSFADSWTDDNSKNGEPLLKGSNINDGQYGFIFEDSSGNIWAMANGSKLQVFDKTQQRWIS